MFIVGAFDFFFVYWVLVKRDGLYVPVAQEKASECSVVASVEPERYFIS
jgi:hypothetical protein